MHKELESFGLTPSEIKVYLACLKLGSSTVSKISTEAGTFRSYTYDILKGLKEKGLVSYVIRSNKQYFESVEPDILLDILHEKENLISSILPALNAVYKSQVNKPLVEFYVGIEGYKNILDDMIREGKEILAYGSTKEQMSTLEFYFPNFIKRRIEAGVQTKVITEVSREAIEKLGTAKAELREMRFLPKGIHIPTNTNIYGNKISIVTLTDQVTGIIIENENIANSQRMVFELMWNNLAKTPE